MGIRIYVEISEMIREIETDVERQSLVRNNNTF